MENFSGEGVLYSGNFTGGGVSGSWKFQGGGAKMLFSRGVLPQNRFSRGILTETLEIPGQGVFYEAGNSRGGGSF